MLSTARKIIRKQMRAGVCLNSTLHYKPQEKDTVVLCIPKLAENQNYPASCFQLRFLNRTKFSLKSEGKEIFLHERYNGKDEIM